MLKIFSKRRGNNTKRGGDRMQKEKTKRSDIIVDMQIVLQRTFLVQHLGRPARNVMGRTILQKCARPKVTRHRL
jgi:hypothetical protein